MKLEIWKNDRRIATAPEYSLHRLFTKVGEEFQPRLWPGMKHLGLFHFRRLEMEPPVLFEHLAGVGLVNFLDHADFRVKLQPPDGRLSIYENLRYVHGRSEVMKGTPSITSVLLASVEPAEDYNELRFQTQLPDIYRAYLARPATEVELGT